MTGLKQVVGVGSGGDVDGPALDSLTLDHAARHVRRKAFTCDGGTRIALDLPDAVQLRDGDLLALDDGGTILVRAAPERLIEIATADPARLAILAWHIGNRHAPAQVEAGRILIAHDAVLGRMLESMGAAVREVSEPFEPERGAYHSHGHSHSGGHSHDHPHGA